MISTRSPLRCLVPLVLVLSLAAGLLVTTAAGAGASGPVPVPEVEGPVTGGSRTGAPFWATPFDLAPSGYVEEEYFLSGTASDRGRSGHGHEHTALYKVRLLLRRPADPARFNGTAVLEWFNVSLQSEVEHDWPVNFPLFMGDGYVSAAVSAQQAGVQGVSPLALRNWDPQRYGSLHHPGDAYSYDIFAQAAQALRSGRVLHGQAADIVLGTGTSQSCLRLATYIPELAAGDGVFDGFQPTLCPAPTAIPDTLVPVVWTTSEWEAVVSSRPDGPLLRVWEMAGTSHVNFWEGFFGGVQGWRDATAGGPGVPAPFWDEAYAGQYGERGGSEVNLAPARYAFRAALDHLNRWARDWKEARAGSRPTEAVRPAPAAERLTRSGFVLARDGHGNALGGLRLPALDVPVATYRGEQLDGADGRTFAFDRAELAGLYPTHEAYVAQMGAATDRAVDLGFMRAADRPEWMGRVQASAVGGPA